ncbi:MAG TPA: DUF1707 domain-containing protein [Actinomycetospora sp.]|nr:DUF1707 domain-containing protein [Actinomycetospora sp.]
MTEPPPQPAHPSPRIGTAEREAAMAALDAHLEAGRLDPEEYGERSARVTEARTADELEPLFADLPEPRPHVGSAAVPAPVTAAGPPAERPAPGVLARYGPAISGALPIIALILFFTVPIPHAWVFFLLIPLGGALFARSRRGDDGRDGD